MHEQQQDLGKTTKALPAVANQQQEPEPSRDASRELDALIAEKVMGWERSVVGNTPWQMIPPGEDRYIVRNVPHYSTDIAAAWLVVERMRDLGWAFEYQCIHKHDATFSRRGGSRERVHADDCETAPLAICRAALLAVGAA